MMERYICIHGHFYQPPRENPWLEEIEIQDSAYPYHDWNEKITAECYAPNSAARNLDKEGRILNIMSNYDRMSFNFGSTLLSWLEKNDQETYQAILDADRQSMEWRSGHGNAFAQVYNHIIMPLANKRDKRTQILWGIKDFEYRFKHFPEGMWLAETAVDIETLDLLAEYGINFTILSPRQAAKVRRIGTGKWRDVSNARIDPSRAYLYRLPSGRMINLFFYDGPISRAVAFEDLLKRGEDFGNRLLTGFSDTRQWPQILNVATDGETYGHHHKFGDMALAYAVNYIESNGLARITNYGEYLELHPPTHEVQIFENSSWSCIHGIERWRSNCGCNSGGHSGWNQEWRKPLRDALDWLRDRLAFLYENMASEYLKNPWEARDNYIDVILDRSGKNIMRFFDGHTSKSLSSDEKVTVLKLLEIQRHAMLMYTSCGWFFDELSGLETIQVLQYAGRAIQFSEEIFHDNLEDSFKMRLALAKSNVPEHENGAQIYEKLVKPAMIDLKQVGAHYAISSLFEEYIDETFKKRIKEYTLKASREAKVNTSWINPNTIYEDALMIFIETIMNNNSENQFLKEFKTFQGKISQYGMFNSLSQTLLKITSPGVPDFYQGTEIWDFSLVDPDNRQPVDYPLRIKMFEEIKKRGSGMPLHELARDLTIHRENGMIKLYLTYKALNYRKEKKEIFERGEYLSLEVMGKKADNVCAFARRIGNARVIIAVPRFFTKLIPQPTDLPFGEAVWEDSFIIVPIAEPEAHYRNIFTDEYIAAQDYKDATALRLSEVLAHYPLAMLERFY